MADEKDYNEQPEEDAAAQAGGEQEITKWMSSLPNT